MRLIGELLINVISLLVVEYVVPGFVLANLETAFVAAIVIGVVNTFIRPILQIIALPISILTLGIFAFLVNVALLWAVSFIVPGFEISSFLTAAIASIVLSLVSAFLHKLAKQRENNY
jgi:putative membrane protein